jgi:hypothetical protein
MAITLETARGYPKLTLRNDYGFDGKEKFYAAGSLSDFMAAIAALPTTRDFGSATLDKVGYGEISPWMEGIASGFECEVLYAQKTPNSIMVGTAGPFSFISELEDSETQRPIECHPSFKMQWGFNLATKPGGTPLPDFAAKTSVAMTEAERKDNIWIRDQAESPTGATADDRWTVLEGQQRTKPQLQSFITNSIQLIAYRYDTNPLDAADASVAFVSGGRIKPSSVGVCALGWKDNAENWLVVGSSIKQEGFLWRVSVRLLYSDENQQGTPDDYTGWDKDVYEDITPT